MESWKKDGHTYYRVRGPLVPQLQLNEFVYDESGERPLHALVKEKSGRIAVFETLRDYTHAKNSVWGINARNREQNFALNLLMNPDDRLRHPARPGRHRQDAAHARRRA